MLKRKKTGQVILEFTFSMIIIMLMIYAAIKIFRWSGVDLVERRKHHDQILMQPITEDVGTCTQWFVPGGGGFPVCTAEVPVTDGPLKQIDPYFHKAEQLNAVWSGY